MIEPYAHTKSHTPKMKIGTVLVFKDSVTKEQAEAILNVIGAVVEGKPQVNEYDASWGSGPVWYIP